MANCSAWGGVSGAQVVKQGHAAHGEQAEEDARNVEDTIKKASTLLSSLLDKAKDDVHVSDLLQQLETLLSQLDGLISSKVLASLRGSIAALLRVIKQQATDIAKLQSNGEKLQSEVEKLNKELESFKSDRSKVMLGQLAYTLDKVAREYVFGPGCTFMTFADLVKLYKANTLSLEQNARFEKFSAFMRDKGYEMKAVSALLGPLREVRYEPAHGRPAELSSVTKVQLQDWGQECGLPQNLLQKVLGLLEPFTEPNKPLVLLPNASQVVQ